MYIATKWDSAIGLALMNLVLGLTTELHLQEVFERGADLLRKGQCLVQKTQPNYNDDDDDREGEKLLGKQELQNK